MSVIMRGSWSAFRQDNHVGQTGDARGDRSPAHPAAAGSPPDMIYVARAEVWQHSQQAMPRQTDLADSSAVPLRCSDWRRLRAATTGDGPAASFI